MPTVSALISWLGIAPPGASALLSSILAASVAVAVTILTQWVIGRRGRSEFLLRKLEELYLEVENCVVDAHLLHDHCLMLFDQDTGEVTKREYVSPKALQARYRKLRMLVLIDFPKLWRTLQQTYETVAKIYEQNSTFELGYRIDPKRFETLHSRHIEGLRAIEDEIIGNQGVLTRGIAHPWPPGFGQRHGPLIAPSGN